MKKFILLVAFALSLYSNEFKVDKEKSDIQFSASKFLFVGVEGKFTNFSGNISTNEKNEISSIDALIVINSINTEDEERDEHLKANDYFNIEMFPKIVFKSKSIKDNIVKAEISIKGIKKDLDFKINEIKVNGKEITFSLESVINRQDFMLNGSMSAVIADNVDINASITAVIQ